MRVWVEKGVTYGTEANLGIRLGGDCGTPAPAPSIWDYGNSRPTIESRMGSEALRVEWGGNLPKSTRASSNLCSTETAKQPVPPRGCHAMSIP